MSLKLIYRNVYRHLQTYTIYFVSLVLIYSLLYAFNALPSHPVMQSLSGSKEMLTTIMSQYMGLLSYLVLGSIAFLVAYATHFVIGRRKKELGLYASLGMTKQQLIRTLFFETLLVNGLALLLGGVLGNILLILLAKLASEFFMANYFGHLFFLDGQSLHLLGHSYLVTTAIIWLMGQLIFKRQNIISLIQENGVAKVTLTPNKPYLQVLLCLLSSAIILWGSYYLSDYQHLSILKHWGILLISVFVFFVVLFYQTLSQFLITLLTRLPHHYFRGLNSFKLRQTSKQADKHAITLAVLSLTLTLATSLLVFSGSAYTSMVNDMDRFHPFDLDVQGFRGEKYHFNHLTVREKLDEDGFDLTLIQKDFEHPIYNSALTYKDLIDTSQLWKLDEGLGDSFVPILALSDYNRLMTLQEKEAVTLADDAFLVNANYKGTQKQIREFLAHTETLEVASFSLKRAQKTPLEQVYSVTSIENNDRGTLIVPDHVAQTLKIGSQHYVARYQQGIDKRKIEGFMEDWVERYYFEDPDGFNTDFVYQTKVRGSELYLGVTGVVILVLIFIGGIFTVISLSILALQASTHALDSRSDYRILHLLGHPNTETKRLLWQQIISYFAIPLVLTVPLAIALSQSMLGYFKNFANITISIDLSYLGILTVLFITYITITYKVSWKIVDPS